MIGAAVFSSVCASAWALEARTRVGNVVLGGLGLLAAFGVYCFAVFMVALQRAPYWQRDEAAADLLALEHGLQLPTLELRSWIWDQTGLAFDVTNRGTGDTFQVLGENLDGAGRKEYFSWDVPYKGPREKRLPKGAHARAVGLIRPGEPNTERICPVSFLSDNGDPLVTNYVLRWTRLGILEVGAEGAERIARPSGWIEAALRAREACNEARIDLHNMLETASGAEAKQRTLQLIQEVKEPEVIGGSFWYSAFNKVDDEGGRTEVIARYHACVLNWYDEIWRAVEEERDFVESQSSSSSDSGST